MLLPATTKEYLRTTVTTSADPTGTPPQFAFLLADTEPVTADWRTGEWVGAWTNGSVTARILVGPGTSVVFTPGNWRCWLRITDNPEIPVMRVDLVRVPGARTLTVTPASAVTSVNGQTGVVVLVAADVGAETPAGAQAKADAAEADAIAAAAADATAKADAKVALTGNQTVAGVKTFTSSPVVPAPTTGLQAATKQYVDDNAGGAPPLLGLVAYNPATKPTLSTTSTSLVDIDATNLAVTFTAPASGAVLVRLTGVFDNSTAATAQLGLREGASAVAGALSRLGARHDLGTHESHTIKVSDLTPDSVHTYKWAWATSAGTLELNCGGTGVGAAGAYGAAVMEVWEIPL